MVLTEDDILDMEVKDLEKELTKRYIKFSKESKRSFKQRLLLQYVPEKVTAIVTAPVVQVISRELLLEQERIDRKRFEREREKGERERERRTSERERDIGGIT